MKPIDKLGRRERDVIESRTTGAPPNDELAHFDAPQALTLRALLARLLPGVPAHIDLAAFVDEHLEAALGRGDRKAGVPPNAELIVDRISVLTGERFSELSADERDDVIRGLRRGERGVDDQEFVDRLLDKALMGYLAHPDTWSRIGFNGPAYPPGYAWITSGEVAARHERKAGWDKL